MGYTACSSPLLWRRIFLPMKWKSWILAKAEMALKRASTPLFYKELAWRAILFVQTCGRSNPISFALRPYAMHKRLKASIGLGIALLVIFTALWGPLPTNAGSIGGQIELVVQPEGEISLVTDEAVVVPLNNYRISQKYWFLHAGLDMAALTGEEIRPVMAGRVVKAEKSWYGYGNMVIVAHNAEYESLYGHMSKILVKEGQEVDTNTVLGLVGSTGHSTGPHLHLEIRENGKTVNPAVILGIKP